MDNYFSDYDAYSEDSVVNILSDGIQFSDDRSILFDECAQNGRQYSENEPDTNCIGEKDTDDGSFMFYCSPRPVMIKFFPRLFSKSVPKRMSELENQINRYGYSLTFCKKKEDR